MRGESRSCPLSIEKVFPGIKKDIFLVLVEEINYEKLEYVKKSQRKFII